MNQYFKKGKYEILVDILLSLARFIFAVIKRAINKKSLVELKNNEKNQNKM